MSLTLINSEPSHGNLLNSLIETLSRDLMTDRPRARITDKELTAGYKRLFGQAEHDPAARGRLRRVTQIFAKAAIRIGDLRLANELLNIYRGHPTGAKPEADRSAVRV